jgi:DNA-binding PadR family transcriptional regulator
MDDMIMAIDKKQAFREAFSAYSFQAGFLKIALLKMISEEASHGYALIRKIESITQKDWKPSPGSIYPALQELENKGLVESRTEERKIIYSITERGQLVLEASMEHMKMVMAHLRNLFSDQEI